MSTRTESVYAALKADLLAGAFEPGERLRTEPLMARYGCGVSPLREALMRLASEALVAAEGHRGFAVPQPEAGSVEDIYRTRCFVEREALRLSIERGDEAWEAGILAACHLLDRSPAPVAQPGAPASGAERSAWEARHRAFHWSLLAAAGSPSLLAVVGQLYDRTELYRRLRLVGTPPATLARNVAEQHRALADAALARDTARALATLTAHLEQTAAFIAGRLLAAA